MAGGRPIETEITTDVSGVIKGAEKVADSFEDVQDSLKDTAKAGDKAFEQLEDSAQDAAKVIDRDLTRALEEVEQKAKATGKAVGKSVKDGADTGSEGLADMKSEAASTATESAASFASIEDAAGALQEVAANAFAGFGPAGAAAGIVAAAGIGLAISALQDNADKINENKEKMLDLAKTIRENGGVLKEADYIKQMDEYGYSIQDTKEWFELFQSDAVSGFEKLKKAAEASGLSTKQIFEGGFGGADEAKQTLDLVNKKLTEAKDRSEALYNLDGSIDPVNSDAITTLEDYKKQVEQNIKAQELAKQIEADRKRGIEGTTEALRENIEAIEKQTDATKGAITSELDYMDSVEDLSTKLTDSTNAWDINTAAGRDNQRAVIDIASGIEDMAKAEIDAGGNVDAVTAKFNAQKDALINQVAPAFGGSKEAARQYIEQILKTPTETKTTVKLQGEQEVRDGLNRLSKPVSVLLNPEAPTETYFQRVLSGMSNRSVPVNLVPRNGGPAAP